MGFRPETRAFLCAAAGAVFFGLSTPCSKILLGKASPLLLAAIYYLSGAAFVLCVPGAARGLAQLRARSRSDLALLAGSALSGGVLAPVLMLYGLRSIDAASASLLFSLEVAFTALVAGLLFGEHISRRVAWASLLAMVSGTLLGFEGGFAFSSGALLLAASCMGWAFDNNMTARMEGVSPQTCTVAKGLAAGSTNLALWLSFHGQDVPSSLAIVGAVGVGFFAYGLSTLLYIFSSRSIGAARSQVIFSANPFIGAAASYAVFGSGIMNWRQGVAGLGMAAALGLIYSERHEHLHRHEALEHEHSHSHDDGHHGHGHLQAMAHSHRHSHEALEHAHAHYPDLHHRHGH